MRGVKFLGVLAIACALAGCMTLENRRDLYTADFDRWPVSSATPTPVQTTRSATNAPQPQTQRVTTRKTPPEVKPIPSEPEETTSLPPPLPTP